MKQAIHELDPTLHEPDHVWKINFDGFVYRDRRPAARFIIRNCKGQMKLAGANSFGFCLCFGS